MAPPPSTYRLANKTAIVTGGASGFGAAIASRFAAEGAAVIIADINQDGAREVITGFRTEYGVPEDKVEPGVGVADGECSTCEIAEKVGSIQFVKVDVTSLKDWTALMAHAVKSWGEDRGVDILVNNAGTTYRNKPTLDVTEAEFEKVFDVNVKSIFNSIGTFVPQVIERGKGGVIINVASIGASRPRPGLVWYNASKAAVANATKGLAAEYGPKQLRVNAVCPLLCGTGLFESFVGVPDTPANREKFLFNVPLGRLCETKNVADACLFLASEEGSFITGTCLDVDGGRGI